MSLNLNPANQQQQQQSQILDSKLGGSNINNLQQQHIYRQNKECLVNVNNLLGSRLIKFCKFCESVVLDDEEFFSRKQSDLNKAAQSSASATASSSINENNNNNNETYYYFCTKKCLNAFYKYLNLQNQ